MTTEAFNDEFARVEKNVIEFLKTHLPPEHIGGFAKDIANSSKTVMAAGSRLQMFSHSRFAASSNEEMRTTEGVIAIAKHALEVLAD